MLCGPIFQELLRRIKQEFRLKSVLEEVAKATQLDVESVRLYFFCIFFCGLECVGHYFAYVAHFVFLGDVWIRTQRAAVASRSTANSATLALPI
jgi:hypothetical protein